jgi:hypothetical protein
MTDQRDELAIEIIRLFLSAIEAKDERERQEFAGEIHRILVLIDDRICNEFNFTRKARYKKALTK